jgi:hypothetical protein
MLQIHANVKMAGSNLTMHVLKKVKSKVMIALTDVLLELISIKIKEHV